MWPLTFSRRMMKLLFKAFLGLFAILFGLGLLAWLSGPSLLSGEGDMSEPRSEIHAAELDGTIYVAGGIGFFRTLSSCAAFDTQSQRFSDCPKLPRALHHVAMAAGEGKVFASGGYESLPFNQDPLGALFVLDVEKGAGAWTELAPLPAPLGQHAMFYREGAIWLVGGESQGNVLASLQVYDLATGEWSQRASMPTARHSHAIALSNDRLFVTGGRSGELGLHSLVIEAYDFTNNSWSALPDAPFPLAGHGATVFEGRLHVFGGENVDANTVFTSHASIDLADPDAGWREEVGMAYPRHGLATARVGDTAWILGGGKRAGMHTPYSVTGTAFPLNLR